MRAPRLVFFLRRLRRYRGANFQIRNTIAATDTPMTTTCATLDKVIALPGCNGFDRGSEMLRLNQRRNLLIRRVSAPPSSACLLYSERRKISARRVLLSSLTTSG